MKVKFSVISRSQHSTYSIYPGPLLHK